MRIADQQPDRVALRLVDLREHDARVGDAAPRREPRAVRPVHQDPGRDVRRDHLTAVRRLDRDPDADRAAEVALYLLVDLEPVQPLGDARARNSARIRSSGRRTRPRASAMRSSIGVWGQVYACATPVKASAARPISAARIRPRPAGRRPARRRSRSPRGRDRRPSAGARARASPRSGRPRRRSGARARPRRR